MLTFRWHAGWTCSSHGVNLIMASVRTLKLTFRVRSSSGNGLYLVEASKVGENLRLTCTCEAGDHGMHCKHRINLLLGDLTDLVDGREQDVIALRDLAVGTEVAKRLAEVIAIEREMNDARRRLSASKKALARAMEGG